MDGDLIWDGWNLPEIEAAAWDLAMLGTSFMREEGRAKIRVRPQDVVISPDGDAHQIFTD